MTTEEFGQWVEQHYGDLLAVARRRIDFDPEDAVQGALERMLRSPELTKRTTETIWPWAAEQVRGMAKDIRVSREREAIRVEKSLSSGALLHGDL